MPKIQVDEWLAENAITPTGVAAAEKSLHDFRQAHPELVEGAVQYQWMIATDPCQSDELAPDQICPGRIHQRQ